MGTEGKAEVGGEGGPDLGARVGTKAGAAEAGAAAAGPWPEAEAWAREDAEVGGGSRSGRRRGVGPRERLAKLWKSTKDGTAHAFWWLVNGMRDMGYDVRLMMSLIAKQSRGQKLTRREAAIMTRTSKDVFKLFPMIPFVVIPAAEFLLPVVLKVFPSMLPTQFADKSKLEQSEEQRALAQLEGSRLLLNSLSRLAQKKAAPKEGNADPEMAAFAVFLDRILLGRQNVHTEEICKLVPLFEEKLTLARLPRGALEYLGIMWAIPNTNGNSEYLSAQLEDELANLEKDDKAIRKDGIVSMTNSELREACRKRNIRSFDLDNGTLREYLNDWLDLHLDRKVPPSLLLLSRAFMMASKGFMPVSRRWRTTRTNVEDSHKPFRSRNIPARAAPQRWEEEGGRPMHVCPSSNFDPYGKLLLVCALAKHLVSLAQGPPGASTHPLTPLVRPGAPAVAPSSGGGQDSKVTTSPSVGIVAGKDLAGAAASLGASGADVRLLLEIVSSGDGGTVPLVDLLNLAHPQFPEALAYDYAIDPNAWPSAFRDWGMAEWSDRVQFCARVRNYLAKQRSGGGVPSAALAFPAAPPSSAQPKVPI